MRKNSIIVILAIAVIAIATYIFWSKGKHSNQANVIKIGFTQTTPHAIFEDTKKGFLATFAANGYKNGENIQIDFENGQGDPSINQAIAQKFAQSDYVLFVSLGTQASQTLANVIKDRPIVFGTVTDPVTAQLVKTNEHPGGNITGTSDVTLYKEQLELLKKIKPDVKKVGLVFNPAEANGQYAVKESEKYAKQLGLIVVTAPANNTGEVLSAARSIVDKVDAFYILPDNTALAAQSAIIRVGIEAKKPVIALDESGVEQGALATLGTNYIKVGEKTAEITLRILKGEKPANIPVIGVTDADLFINTTTAEKINMPFSEEMQKQAKHIYK